MSISRHSRVRTKNRLSQPEKELDYRSLQTNRRPPAWATKLSEDICDRYDLFHERPRVVFVPARYEGTFAGRHFPDVNAVAVLDGDGPKTARAVLVHEHVHFIRKFNGDPDGKHDRAFYLLADELYEFYDVPKKLATYVESCDGPMCETNLIRRVR